MQDPIQRHPTREEQLDILVGLIADLAEPGDAVLDLGCGTGYVGHLLLGRCDDIAFTGVDRNGAALAEARANLSPLSERLRFCEADLTAPDTIVVGDGPFRFIVSALTFHDLPDADKAALLGWAARRLAADGYMLLYDRIRLTEAPLFPLQTSIWRRIERVHGRAMRGADSFEAYLADLADNNRPASLADYGRWFADARLVSQPLHTHGNTALIAAARAAG